MNPRTPTTSSDDGLPRAARLAVLTAVPIAAGLGVAVLSTVLEDSLPARLATHWSGRSPDGFMSLQLFTAVAFLLTLGLGLGLVLLSKRAPDRTVARLTAASGVGLSVFLATLFVGTLLANRGTDGVDVPFPAAVLGVALALGAAFGAFGWWVTPEVDPDRARERVLEPTELTIEPGEAVVWAGSATGERWFLLLPMLMAVFAVVLFAVGEPRAAWVVLGSVLVVVAMLRVTVTIGPAGVQVRGGPLGVLRTHVPLHEITGVTAEHVEPMRYGGWGYRVVPGCRAITIRCGPGIRLQRGDRPDLVVTVDDAQRGAGVLLAHLAAAQGRSA